jgi:hypothetical protein
MTSGHNNRKGRNKGHRHSGQRPRGSQPANAPIVQPKPAAAPLAPPAMPPSPTVPTFGPPEDSATPPPAVSMPQQVAHPEQAPSADDQPAKTLDAAPPVEDATPALPPLTEEPRLEPERFQPHDSHPGSRQDLRQEPRMRHPLPAPAPAPARPQSPRDTAPRPPLARPRTGEASQPYLPHGANGHQNGYHNGHTHDRTTEPPMTSDRFVLANRADMNDWRDDERDERYEGGERPMRQLDVRGDVGPLIDSLRTLFADNRAVASQGGVARCGICYLYFRSGDLTYREQEGFYVCASCASALGATHLPMVRRQQR